MTAAKETDIAKEELFLGESKEDKSGKVRGTV